MVVLSQARIPLGLWRIFPDDGSREGIFDQGRDKNIGIEQQPHRADFA